MKRSRTLFAILSILSGGFLFVSLFIDRPVLQTGAAELLLWAERLLAALLFFTIIEAAVSRIRKTDSDAGMRINRTLGFGVFLAVLILGLIKGPESAELNRIVFFVQQSFESALAGIVCISLLYAVYRMPSQKSTVMKTAFFVGLVVFLGIYSGIPQMAEGSGLLSDLFEWIESIPRGAVMGLMIGIAIGGAVTGIRYIFSGKLPAKEDK
ncbi:MAG: hypothetical protein IKP86_09895 [Anaerolineaceae bacterium]|nr:hypothetical protein [Anaerolineaceae bacterium]